MGLSRGHARGDERDWDCEYWPMFEPRVPGFVHIPSPYPYRYVGQAFQPDRNESSASPPQVAPGRSGMAEMRMTQGIAAANELEQAIVREGPDTVAMFLAEPVQGAGGVIVPQDDYFPRIREICDRYDVLFVSDEVITGFGRTGKMFGLEHWNVQPDMILFAKAITSGYFPLGGVGLSEEIAATLDTAGMIWMHAYTYSATRSAVRSRCGIWTSSKTKAFRSRLRRRGRGC